MTLKVRLTDLRPDLDPIISREKFAQEDREVFIKSRAYESAGWPRWSRT